MISSEIFEKSFKDFNVVLQLRSHPEIIKLKENFKRPEKVDLTIKVFREYHYWDGWKGSEELSGGILYNIGVHYIDLVMYLLGDEYEIIDTKCSDKLATGIIDFMGSIVNYHIEIMDTNEGQTRSLRVDDEDIELSNKDNLSYENLHIEVYEEMLKGRGTLFSDCYNLIKLIEKLKCNSINCLKNYV